MEKTDIQHSHALVAHMHNADRSEVLRRGYFPQEILALMSHFEFAVGMRLHFLIFAAQRRSLRASAIRIENQWLSPRSRSGISSAGGFWNRPTAGLDSPHLGYT